MAIGAAWDRYLARREDGEAAEAELPDLVMRPEYEITLHANGTLIAVTTRRLIGWKIAGLGRPRDLILDISLDRIDQVVWDEAKTKALRGKPASTLIWMGVDHTVLPMAAISGGVNRRYVQGVISALGSRLPGRVSRFEA